MRRAFITFTAALLCVAMVACGNGNKGIKVGTKHKVGDDATYSIEGADQTSNGKAVKVPEAYLKEKGYIAIHSDANGAPGPVIGVSQLLDSGEIKDTRIKLTQPLKASADIWPMVHLEDNNNTTYDFPNGDAPAKAPNGQVVVVKVHVTVR
jgi:hypothetical protein